MSGKKHQRIKCPAPKIIVTPVTPISRYIQPIEERIKQATMAQLINEVKIEANKDSDFKEKLLKKYKTIIIPDVSSLIAVGTPPKLGTNKDESVISAATAAAKTKRNMKMKQPKKIPFKTVKVDSVIMRNPYSQGDSVMITARDIVHPTYTHGETVVLKILGALTHIVPKDDQIYDKVNVLWMMFSNETMS